MSETSSPAELPVKSQGNVRILAPDLARGLTLLGIAVANSTTAWLPADSDLPGAFVGGIFQDSIWDKIAAIFGAVFFHVRGLPMFSTMLGYGIGMLMWSLHRRGYPLKPARNVLLRRYGLLALFGLLHFLFIFYGDIMFFYGIAGMLVACMIHWRTQTILAIAGTLLGVYVFSTAASAVVVPFVELNIPAPSEGQLGSRLPHSWAEYINVFPVLFRQVAFLPFELLMLLPLVMIGFVAARFRVLEEPEQHKKLLKRVALLGAIIALGVGLPWGLAEIGVFSKNTVLAFLVLNQGLGLLTGPGIIAIIALAAIPLQQRYTQGQHDQNGYKLPIIVQMLTALGKRSMTGYVMQSLILLPLCAPFLLHALKPQGAAFATLVGFIVWVIALIVAFILEKLHLRGPFEAAHRRLSYGKAGLHKEFPREIAQKEIEGGATKSPVQKLNIEKPDFAEEPQEQQ